MIKPVEGRSTYSISPTAWVINMARSWIFPGWPFTEMDQGRGARKLRACRTYIADHAQVKLGSQEVVSAEEQFRKLTAEALALARARGWVSRRNLHQWETHYAPIMAVDLFKTVVDDSGVLAEILSAVDEEKR